MSHDSSTAIGRWYRLLDWLKGHGMDLSPDKFRVERRPTRSGAGFGLFATKFCPASEPLFIIPAAALINVRTLAAHYPNNESLTATQLISHHLFLFRPEGGHESVDALFGPFISILPRLREFDSHPLTWLVRRTINRITHSESMLLDLLPLPVALSLMTLKNRFIEDWSAVSKYMESHAPRHQKSNNTEPIIGYLWAWLNVNTRCIYRRLKPSRSDSANITLCPVLDFANHSWKVSQMIPVSNAEIWNTAPSAHGDDFPFLASEKGDIKPGEEIYLTYGAHSNRTLFIEYGFINDVSPECIRSGEYPGEIDVQQIIEELFGSRAEIGVWMRKVLEDEGYWGDWTLHSSPQPASPSFRTTSALRLYAMFSEWSGVPEPGLADVILGPWRNTLLGIQDRVSDNNELAWKSTLRQICEKVLEDGRIGKSRAIQFKAQSSDHEWVEWMRSNIEGLWDEQMVVADAVLGSIDDGVEF